MAAERKTVTREQAAGPDFVQCASVKIRGAIWYSSRVLAGHITRCRYTSANAASVTLLERRLNRNEA